MTSEGYRLHSIPGGHVYVQWFSYPLQQVLPSQWALLTLPWQCSSFILVHPIHIKLSHPIQSLHHSAFLLHEIYQFFPFLLVFLVFPWTFLANYQPILLLFLAFQNQLMKYQPMCQVRSPVSSAMKIRYAWTIYWIHVLRFSWSKIYSTVFYIINLADIG